MIMVDGGRDTEEGLSVVCERMGYGGSRGASSDLWGAIKKRRKRLPQVCVEGCVIGGLTSLVPGDGLS